MSFGQRPRAALSQSAMELEESARDAEKCVRQWFEDQTVADGNPAWTFRDVGFIVRPDSWPHMYGVSPDGICDSRSCGLEVKEVEDVDIYNSFLQAILADQVSKTDIEGPTASTTIESYLRDTHPRWWAQAQLGMAVTGFEQWAFGLRHRSTKNICASIVTPDLLYIRNMLKDISLVQTFRDVMGSILNLRDNGVLNGKSLDNVHCQLQ